MSGKKSREMRKKSHYYPKQKDSYDSTMVKIKKTIIDPVLKRQQVIGRFVNTVKKGLPKQIYKELKKNDKKKGT